MNILNKKKNILLCGTVLSLLSLSSCVSYEAEDFTGHTLPRKTGYSTGVTNDWLYFDLKTGHRYNVLNPNQSVIAYIDGKPVKEYFGCEGDTTVYWTEGVQKNVFQDYKRDADGNKVLVNPNNPKQGYEMVARKANSLLVMENKEDDPTRWLILLRSGILPLTATSCEPTVAQAA